MGAVGRYQKYISLLGLFTSSINVAGTINYFWFWAATDKKNWSMSSLYWQAYLVNINPSVSDM